MTKNIAAGELCLLHLRAVTTVLGKLERARALLRECADELEALRGEQCYLVTVQAEHIEIGEATDD